jgi:hypothetical protein
VAHALLERGARVFAVTPKKLTAYRKVHCTSPRKDDEFDAWLVADFVRIMRGAATELAPTPEALRALRRYSRELETVVAERVALTAALRALVSDYYPQLLQLPWTLTDRVPVELLAIQPDPRKVDATMLVDIQDCLRRCRRLDAHGVLEILSGPGHDLPPREVDACVDIAHHKVKRLLALREQERTIRAHIRKFLSREAAQLTLTDAAIILSFPGAGDVVTSTLLSEAPGAIASGNRQALRRQSIAPVTIQSGQQHQAGPVKPQVRKRYAINSRLARAMYLWGAKATQNSPYYRNLYTKMRQRGLSHGRSCRQVADRMLTVLFAMLRDRTLYDPDLHGATRRQ